MTTLNATDHPDVYVVGLCLALVVAAAVPVMAQAALWLGLLLLFIVWSRVIAQKAQAAK